MKVHKTDKYVKITAENGMYLTDYKEGDNIINFNPFKVMFLPLNVKYEELYEIDKNTYELLNNEKLKIYRNGKIQ